MTIRLWLRGIWRELSGYNAMRRRRIARARKVREMDQMEREAERLVEKSPPGIERIWAINLLYSVRRARTRAGL